MDDPATDPDTKTYGCHGVGCLIVVALILNATGTCVGP